MASVVLDSMCMTTFPPFNQREGPQHRVYVIEVEVMDKSIPWNLYVGYTNLYLRERWKKYEELSASVSKYFRSGKVVAREFRYDLMKGWGPYNTKEEGIWAEGELAFTLSREGFKVYSEQLKVAVARSSR